jgi:hypothetical protein
MLHALCPHIDVLIATVVTVGRQKNNADPRLRDIASQKAASLKTAVINTASEQPKYRDRASERRIMHNQPDVPLPSEQDSSQKRRLVDGTTSVQTTLGPPQLPSPLPAHPGDDTNIGNKLLKKMGWKEGTGLGYGGEGITEPVYVLYLLALKLSSLIYLFQSNGNLFSRCWPGCEQR